jgi:phosphate acyltransferase
VRTMDRHKYHLQATYPVTLALDAEGGDNAPAEIVAGALEAASEDLRVLLVGRPKIIEPHLRHHDKSHIEIVPSASVISCYQEPASAVRSMQDSSIVVGARTVAEGRSQGFVSAGSTGAMLAASVLLMKRVEGIKRPAIVTTVPGMNGPVVFLDAGANSDCKPDYLLEFGVLGAAYSRAVLGRVEPRVGLLNIGEEEGKGNDLAISSYRLLKESHLNFIGNVEGRDILSNKADVLVTDGFTGNVALKILEGSAASLLARVHAVTGDSGVRGKTGGAFLRTGLRALRGELDPEEYGGTYLLGVQGLSIICHGNATRHAVANALKFGAEALQKGVLQAVEREVAAIFKAPSEGAVS